MDLIIEQLRVPRKYLKQTNRTDRFLALVHRTWLRSLLKNNYLTSFIENDHFQGWPYEDNNNNNNDGASWIKIYITILEKNKEKKVIPLVRIRPNRKYSHLSFSQLLHYVMQSNQKNLWMDAYEKYTIDDKSVENAHKITSQQGNDYDSVLREIIIRTYGCPIITSTSDASKKKHHHSEIAPPHNLLPAICAVESESCIFLIHSPYIKHTLHDCVLFSPAVFDGSQTKKLFIVYQLLHTLLTMHDRNLTLGDVTLQDIYLNDNLWIYIIPQFKSNLHVLLTTTTTTTTTDAIRKETTEQEKKIGKLCQLWIEGQLSNFAYLTALNELAGRRIGEPNNHHVFPWVTDFSSRSGNNWRDLTKSKFRLNKGDRQLDVTYEESSCSVAAHHVSAVLSSITYYVYMARRTPKSVLCNNVRTVWVPAEYPNSIQRLQEWTPDECIPEFFTNACVFKSIHEDLRDLQVPPWSSSPEDFVQKHREALESVYVSERLHHWIDLTFGYKLSGSAAIKSKNVCLQLVDGHKSLTNCGIVQLFTYPHPAKKCATPFTSKMPPKIHFVYQRKRDRSNSSLCTELQLVQRPNEDDDYYCNNSVVPSVEEEESDSRSSSSLVLSRSRSSLNSEETKTGTKSTAHKLYHPTKSYSAAIQRHHHHHHLLLSSVLKSNQNDIIYLPKEYNPAGALIAFESQQNFLTKTFLVQNEEQTSNNNNTHELPTTTNYYSYKQMISSCRIRELQTLGCLITELFLGRYLCSLEGFVTRLEFNQRLKLCVTVLKYHGNNLPRCIKSVVIRLLQQDDVITDIGLPSPSTVHQLLQPLLFGCLFPFPKQFQHLVSFLSTFEQYSLLNDELNILYHFDCDDESTCAKYEHIERTKILCSQNIDECKVKYCAKQLSMLLSSNCNSNIILPYVKELIDDPRTCVLAAWYLFDPIAQALGPSQTAQSDLLKSLLNLYENNHSLTFYNHSKMAKLYHHSFLLCLIVRLGLKTFLDNFITPLVEAVGGYYHYNDDVSLLRHTHHQKKPMIRKTSNLKCTAIDLLLEPPLVDDDDDDDDDEEEEEDSNNSARNASNEPEVFKFEEEEEEEKRRESLLLEHLERNVAKVDLDLNHSTAEEAKEEPQFITIGCDVGSKTEFFLSSVENDPTPCSSSSSSSSYTNTNEKTNNNGTKKTAAAAATTISDMSADSLIWLSHRLGPVLSARYLSRNLLRMLTLCYIGGRDNLLLLETNSDEIDLVTIANGTVLGDRNASKVLHCLVSIAALYGEQLILLQYLPHMSELIALCKRKLTPNLEGGLLSCMTLLKHIIPYLVDSTLMDQLQDIILKNILMPTVRLLGTSKLVFPSGAQARNVLARKYLDTLFVLALRIGADMTRSQLAVPALQRFFFIFNKVYDDIEAFSKYTKTTTTTSSSYGGGGGGGGEHYIEVCRDGTTAEWSVLHGQIRSAHSTDDSFSPPPPPAFKNSTPTINDTTTTTTSTTAMEELRKVFTPELAHSAFVPFLQYLGDGTMMDILKNHNLVRDLSFEYEQQQVKCSGGERKQLLLSSYSMMKSDHDDDDVTDVCVGSTGSFGSNVALIGNRIDVQRMESTTTTNTINSNRKMVLNLVSNKIENTNRHLRGNWLAYWEHEIGRPDNDAKFNFKQIKLQTFHGHTNTIKAIHVLDNENSFMTASKDKTVKLWSLRSQGDGTSVSQCQSTYTGHKKSVQSVQFVESLRVTGSCDGIVHIWDPFMGSAISQLEGGTRTVPVGILRTMPAPSSILFAATDTTVRFIDARICSYVNELKVSLNAIGLVRSMAVSPSGNWLAVGQSTGNITILDTRTGLIQASWKAHEGELLQLAAFREDTLVSSGLDQAVSVWNVNDGKLKFNINMTFTTRGATEPVHCLCIYNSELISGTTANRIGVHTSIDADASFSSTRLRSDTFKGVLTSMAPLPLNRLLLLGADSGHISLLC